MGFEEGGNSSVSEDSTCRIKGSNGVIFDDLSDEPFWWMSMIFREMF